MGDDDTEMRCIVPFPDQSASFVHGFEAGLVWARMEAGQTHIDGNGVPFHEANLEVFRRMAAHFGYDMEAQPGDGTWAEITFTKRRSRLSVVPTT